VVSLDEILLFVESGIGMWLVETPNGLVDEIHLFVVTLVIGGGKPVLPGNVCVQLDLLDERRFANGIVYLRYHTRA
jgi:dihydrofolate reductase